MRENKQTEYKSAAKRNIKVKCGDCKYILYRHGSKVILMVVVMMTLMLVCGDDGDDVETRVKLCLVPSLQLPVNLLNPTKHRQ